jgi:TRAP-type C4-dicarboxylate transport system substrate-binding protein
MKNLAIPTLAAGVLLACWQPAVAQSRLVVNCFWPAKHIACTEILPNWIAEVTRVTEGRVKGIIPPTSVAPPPEQLGSVEKGVVDVAVQFNGLIQNRVTGPLVAMTPFTGNSNAGAMSQALWETNRKFFPDELKGVVLLSQFVISPGELFSQTAAPVNSMAELKSRKIWALPGPLAEITKKIGAGVVATPAVQSGEVISRGVVDAHVGLDPQAVRNLQLADYTKSMTQFSRSLYTTSFSLVMNKDRWDKIAPADQAAILKVSGATFAEMAGSAWAKDNAAALNTLKAKGLKVVAAEPAFEAELGKASEGVTAGWLQKATAAGIDGKAALAFYQKRLAELSK